MSASTSTSSAAPNFQRESMKQSLADEFDRMFEGLNINPIHAVEAMKRPNGSQDATPEDKRKIEIAVPEERREHSKRKGQSESTEIANQDAVPSSGPESIVEQHPAGHNAVPSPRPKKSVFIEHLSPTASSCHRLSHKDNTKLEASKNNRDLIDRNANGFFKMETVPSVIDVQRQTQQAEGIAALQKTLVPATVSNATSSRRTGTHASSSRVVAPVKHPSGLRKIIFAEPRDRKRGKAHDSYLSATYRPQAAAPRFSLARDLIASGHRMRITGPSAPARFVRIPTDPMVGFKRSFAGKGLKIIIPESEPDVQRTKDSVSITSVSDVEDDVHLKLKNDKPKLEFGTPRGFIADQCLESSCPIRWAHAKGPYHHNGHQNSTILTGLFGHSNPPPEIWNAYRNMIRITRDGETISPNERPRPKTDEDVVIAFATFHYGELNGMSGDEFHRRYAGRHISSTVSLRSSSTSSSTRSGGSRGKAGRK